MYSKISWFLGVRRYGLSLLFGFALAEISKRAKDKRDTDRDAVMRHYIKLHPECFPAPRKLLNIKSCCNVIVMIVVN